jgi:hypothetical protein
MGNVSILERTQQLRREMELIQEQELQYRSRKNRSFPERTEHEKRGLRIAAIRDELQILAERAKQQASQSLAWYS